MPKRASCLIIGRHPQVPREVRVVCKQLTGILQLGDCCSHLNIKAQGSKIMTPPEFEAAAGCSKGKNWKVSFGALLQLVSGHASCSLSVVMHHAACQWSCIIQPAGVPAAWTEREGVNWGGGSASHTCPPYTTPLHKWRSLSISF